jgi:hypothetical protein
LARERKYELRFAALARLPGKHLGKLKMICRRAFRDGDCNQVPGFDVTAQGLALEFPELGDDPTRVLWELVNEPIDRMPTADSTMAAVLERLTVELPF